MGNTREGVRDTRHPNPGVQCKLQVMHGIKKNVQDRTHNFFELRSVRAEFREKS